MPDPFSGREMRLRKRRVRLYANAKTLRAMPYIKGRPELNDWRFFVCAHVTSNYQRVCLKYWPRKRIFYVYVCMCVISSVIFSQEMPTF